MYYAILMEANDGLPPCFFREDAYSDMWTWKKIKTDGISLRTVHSCLIIMAVVVSAILIYATFHSSSTFLRLSNATDEFIEMQEGTRELLDASDYLTDQVQLFAIDGEREYMDNYFREAFESRRREEALERLSHNPDYSAALEKLQEAMQGSLELMKREYYAMKLVIEAKGYTDYPEVLRGVELEAKDAALSPADKLHLAQSMLVDSIYYGQKESIRESMRASVAELESITHAAQHISEDDLRKELLMVRIIIVIQAIGIMFMIWLTAQLGINPVLRAVDNIRDDSPIPVIGANEFRYLAKAYNKMYAVYKKSIEHLNYKASHDELTKTYNRAGYELLLSSVDLKSTFLLLIDADHFKEINDTYGHETGDKILQKIAETIRHNFRSDDYICRVGGDEFVVFMVHADQRQNQLIRLKIRQINEELANTADGLPAVSISAGIAHGAEISEDDDLFECADKALYHTKRTGRKGYTFYSALK